MVAETVNPKTVIDPEVPSAAIAEPESAAVPPPDSADAEGVKGPEDGGKALADDAQGEPKPETVTKPPTEAELLRSAIEKRRAFEAGETRVAGLTEAEKAAEQRDSDRRVSYEAAQRQADAETQRLLQSLETRHAEAAQGIESSIMALLEEQGIELSVSQARLLRQDLQSAFGGLKGEAAQIILEPVAITGRNLLRDTLVAQGLMSEREARDLVKGLPLVAAGNPQTGEYEPSLIRAALAAGYEIGTRKGPGEDTVVLKKADLDKQLLEAQKKGEAIARNQNPQRGTVGADGRAITPHAYTLAEIEAMGTNQWLSLGSPEERQRILDAARAGNGR